MARETFPYSYTSPYIHLWIFETLWVIIFWVWVLTHPTPPLHDPPTPPHPWYIFGHKGAFFHGLLHYVSLSVDNYLWSFVVVVDTGSGGGRGSEMGWRHSVRLTSGCRCHRIGANYRCSAEIQILRLNINLWIFWDYCFKIVQFALYGLLNKSPESMYGVHEISINPILSGYNLPSSGSSNVHMGNLCVLIAHIKHLTSNWFVYLINTVFRILLLQIRAAHPQN